MEFKKDDRGKVTGEIKVTFEEAHNLLYALRYYRGCVLVHREDYYYDEHTGEFEADVMKETNKTELENHERLIRQTELIRYDLCPVEYFKKHWKKRGQTGAVN